MSLGCGTFFSFFFGLFIFFFFFLVEEYSTCAGWRLQNLKRGLGAWRSGHRIVWEFANLRPGVKILAVQYYSTSAHQKCTCFAAQKNQTSQLASLFQQLL